MPVVVGKGSRRQGEAVGDVDPVCLTDATMPKGSRMSTRGDQAGLTATDHDALRRLEEGLWKEETRFDPVFLDRVLAEDFREVGRSGRTYRRQETVAVPRQPIHATLPLPEFAIRLLHPDVALVTYESRVIYDGVVEYGRRSSLWSRSPSGWVLRFHQGTPFTPCGGASRWRA